MLSKPFALFALLASAAVAAPLSGFESTNSTATLVKRACRSAANCHSALIANQIHTCDAGQCHKVCKSGYTPSKGKCVKKSSSASKPVALAASSVTAQLRSQGITGFQGVQGPGIASWFHTNSAQDSTNGNSWCGYPYSDSVPGFAPSLRTMLSNFGNSWERAGTAYCGLEAKVTTPDGKVAYLYLADAFDDNWIRQAGSIDVVHGSFYKLFGRTTNNKNDVVRGVQWEFTGKRSDQYKFKGRGG